MFTVRHFYDKRLVVRSILVFKCVFKNKSKRLQFGGEFGRHVREKEILKLQNKRVWDQRSQQKRTLH